MSDVRSWRLVGILKNIVSLISNLQTLTSNLQLLTFIFIFSASTITAQDSILTIDQAIATGLKNNYSIIISKNEYEISKNNYSPGNAGFLPQISLNASGNNAANTTIQSYSNGLELNKPNVKSNVLNSSLGLNWTIFDGFKMFATYDKLRELEAMGDVNVKVQLETTIAQIINAYYDIIRQKQLLKGILDDISISQERVKIAEVKFNIGTASKLDFLQAKVDVNAAKSAFLRQKNALENSKVSLNQLLAQPAEKDFNVKDSIIIIYNPTFDQLKGSILKQNNSLKAAQLKTNIASFGLKEIQSQHYPLLGLNTNYVFSKSQNQAGFVLLNQNLGFNLGFTASMNLFDGFNLNRNINNAQISLLNSKLEYDDLANKVEANLLKAYKIFQSNLQILSLEEENHKVARENVDVALERFRLGTINSLELREAQKSFIDAGNRMVSARYETKISETDLMRLNGELLK